jgi:16S rRNA (adenine1518-N6/adenine1519-N6)-dimethyltransferase
LTSAYNFRAHKSLGQNYIKDPNIIRNIVDSVKITEDDTLLEIGPGPGALTHALLKTPAKKLIIVEKDPQFIDYWNTVALSNPKLQVIHADALKVKLADLSATPLTIVANLPYNVGTELVLNWLETLPLVKSMTLMLQKEVVLRMTADPGSKDYGRLSIMTQWLCRATRLFDVPPTAFRPQPKVTSSIIELCPREAPLFPAEKLMLEKVTAAVFQQRRKMIKKSLQTLVKDPLPLLDTLGIDPKARPETLSIEQFCAFATLLKSQH